MDITVATPQSEELMKIGTSNIEIAKTFIIDSPAMLEEAGNELRNIVGAKKKLNDQRLSITRPIDEAKTKVMDLFRKPIELLEEAEALLKRSISNFQQEQERIRREEQRKADEAAAAERKRIAEEAAALERQGQEALQSGTPEAIERAQEVIAQAEDLRTRQQMTVAPIVDSAPTKVSGISSRQNWKFEITDASLIPREYLMPDEKKISGVVKAMKDATNISGIRAYPESVVSARVA